MSDGLIFFFYVSRDSTLWITVTMQEVNSGSCDPVLRLKFAAKKRGTKED